MVASSPPIGIGSPETLFIIITAMAPEFWAFLTLSTKAQSPLLIIAILPVASAPKDVQASVAAPVVSFARIKSAVIAVVIVGPKFVVGKDS